MSSIELEGPPGGQQTGQPTGQLNTSVVNAEPTEVETLPEASESARPGDNEPQGPGGRPETIKSDAASPTAQATSLSPTEAVATVTGTAPTIQSASSSSNGSSLATGAVAGIAIAMFFVGVAVAFLVAFLLFKRRNRKRDPNVNAAAYNSYADSTPELVMMQKSTGLGGRSSPYVQVSQTPLPPPAPVPVAALPPVAAPDSTSFLPAPASERDVYSKVSALFNQIHRHVDTYYRDVHASITSSVEPELARFGGQGVNMVELLQECSNPTTALKHALVAYILGMTGPRKDGEGETLFPDSLNETRIASANTNSSDTDLVAAVTLHRRLSAYIFSTQNSLSNPRRSWSFQSDIREAAEHFSLTFFPWANPTSSDQDKEEDLARLISEALELRVWLFGQPETYDFVWEGTGRRGILISPGLLRRSEDGDESEDRLVVEGSVASI